MGILYRRIGYRAVSASLVPFLLYSPSRGNNRSRNRLTETLESVFIRPLSISQKIEKLAADLPKMRRIYKFFF